MTLTVDESTGNEVAHMTKQEQVAYANFQDLLNEGTLHPRGHHPCPYELRRLGPEVLRVAGMTIDQARSLALLLNANDIKPITGVESIDDALEGLSLVPSYNKYATQCYGVAWEADKWTEYVIFARTEVPSDRAAVPQQVLAAADRYTQTGDETCQQPGCGNLTHGDKADDLYCDWHSIKVEGDK